MSETDEAKATMGGPLFVFLRRIPRDDWIVVASVLVTKVLLFVFGAESYRILQDKPLPPDGWLQIWNRWDSVHYQRLAQVGYESTSVLKAWFYPLFPWTVRFVSRLIDGNYLVGAFIVSGIALVAAAILLRRLVQLDFSGEVAHRAVWFFLIFPTAYFLHIGYTESLFIALALGSIMAARRERWWLAGLLGAFSWMTRATGLILLPTLAVEAAHQFVLTKRWQWRWLWIALVPAGFAVYLLLNFHISGDAFAFLRVRRDVFAISFGWPWAGIHEAVGNLRRSPNQAEIVGAQELYFAALGLVCVVVSWFKLRPSYATWITAGWLLLNCVRFIQSEPRYALTLFPIFILFALLAANRFWNLVITMWSLLFLGLFICLFVRGWWAF